MSQFYREAVLNAADRLSEASDSFDVNDLLDNAKAEAQSKESWVPESSIADGIYSASVELANEGHLIRGENKGEMSQAITRRDRAEVNRAVSLDIPRSRALPEQRISESEGNSAIAAEFTRGNRYVGLELGGDRPAEAITNLATELGASTKESPVIITNQPTAVSGYQMNADRSGIELQTPERQSDVSVEAELSPRIEGGFHLATPVIGSKLDPTTGANGYVAGVVREDTDLSMYPEAVDWDQSGVQFSSIDDALDRASRMGDSVANADIAVGTAAAIVVQAKDFISGTDRPSSDAVYIIDPSVMASAATARAVTERLEKMDAAKVVVVGDTSGREENALGAAAFGSAVKAGLNLANPEATNTERNSDRFTVDVSHRLEAMGINLVETKSETPEFAAAEAYADLKAANVEAVLYSDDQARLPAMNAAARTVLAENSSTRSASLGPVVATVYVDKVQYVDTRDAEYAATNAPIDSRTGAGLRPGDTVSFIPSNEIGSSEADYDPKIYTVLYSDRATGQTSLVERDQGQEPDLSKFPTRIESFGKEGASENQTMIVAEPRPMEIRIGEQVSYFNPNERGQANEIATVKGGNQTELILTNSEGEDRTISIAEFSQKSPQYAYATSNIDRASEAEVLLAVDRPRTEGYGRAGETAVISAGLTSEVESVRLFTDDRAGLIDAAKEMDGDAVSRADMLIAELETLREIDMDRGADRGDFSR